MKEIASAASRRNENLFGWESLPVTESPPIYPETPGWKEPTTSKAAADSVAESAKSLRGRIFKLLQAEPDGLSSDQIAEHLHILRWSVRPRIAELRAAGKVAPTGKTVTNETGRAAQVWRASHE